MTATIGLYEIGSAGDRESDLVIFARGHLLGKIFAVRDWRDMLEKMTPVLRFGRKIE